MAQHPTSFFQYRTPIGAISLMANDQGLMRASFGETDCWENEAPRRACAITNQAANELLEYLAGKRTAFTVPFAPEGSDFQLSVWSELARIPYGETRTSAQIAHALNMNDGHRSVGAAIKKNPLCVFIPDHRIVNAAGKTLGTGEEAHHRAMLLAFEQAQLNK